MVRGRRIAFDYGDVRIGVAVCDPDGIVCTPLDPLVAKEDLLRDQILQLIAEYEPIYIAIGEPKHLSGEQSSKMLAVQQFCEFIKSFSAIPIRLVDERLSTVSASSQLRASGRDSRSQRGFIDSAAAAVILERSIALDQRDSKAL